MNNPVTIGETLERLIDNSSVTMLLQAIASVMRDKSEHIAANWQDATLAAAWDKAASDVDKLAARFHCAGIPGIGR